MSAEASLEKFGEKTLVFMKWRSSKHYFLKQMDFRLVLVIFAGSFLFFNYSTFFDSIVDMLKKTSPRA